MEETAASGDYTQALLEMDALVTALDAFKAELETARQGQAYEQLMAQMEPRIMATAASTYGPMIGLSGEIEAGHQAAMTAASSGDYPGAIATLEGLTPKLDAYDAQLAEIEAAKSEYETGVPEFDARFGQLQSEHAELMEENQALVDQVEQMRSAATDGNYPHALQLLDQSNRLLDQIETRDGELDLARAEYESRIAALTQRLDAIRECDFDALEADRAEIDTLRSEMETAASGNDFAVALEKMNAVAEKLDALDIRIAELEEAKRLYEEALAGIQDLLRQVEDNTSDLMAEKKAEIIGIRDEMTAAAEQTDYETALSKCLALGPLIAEFLRLDALRDDYERRKVEVDRRMEAMRAFTFKSLDALKEEAETLYTSMQEKAAATDFDGAVGDITALETKLGEIETKNAALVTAKAAYDTLFTVLDPKITACRDADVDDDEEVKKLKTTAIATADAMLQQAEKDEFVEAEALAKKLGPELDAFEAAFAVMDAEARQKYEGMSPGVIDSLTRAKDWSEEFPKTLGDDYEDLEELGGKMTDAAGKEDFETAMTHLLELKPKLDDFGTDYQDIRTQKTDFDSDLENVEREFGEIDEDAAKEKADGPYGRARSYIDDAKDEAQAEEFEAAGELLDDALEEIGHVEEALKTQEEAKAEFEGRKTGFINRLENAAGSKFKAKLTDKIEDIQSALEDFIEQGEEDGDYKGALKTEAPKVDEALAQFDAAEDVLEQTDAKFQQLMQDVKRPYDLAVAVEDGSLASRVGQLPTMKAEAESLGEAGDPDAALSAGQALFDEVMSILEESERLEDEREEDQEREEDEGEEDGVVREWLKDRASDVYQGAKDIGNAALDGVQTVGRGLADTPEAISEFIESEDRGVFGEAVENAAQWVLENPVDAVANRVGGAVEHGASGVQNVGQAFDDAVDGEWGDAARNLWEAAQDADKVTDQMPIPIPKPTDIAIEIGETIDKGLGNVVEEAMEMKEEAEEAWDTLSDLYEKGKEVVDAGRKD
jgi:chromosome segregation ATPase